MDHPNEVSRRQTIDERAVKALEDEGWDLNTMQSVRCIVQKASNAIGELGLCSMSLEKKITKLNTALVKCTNAHAEVNLIERDLMSENSVGLAVQNMQAFWNAIVQAIDDALDEGELIKAKKAKFTAMLEPVVEHNVAPICCICSVRHVTRVIVPCGHTFCTPCSDKIGIGTQKCFMCRTHCSAQYNIFFS